MGKSKWITPFLKQCFVTLGVSLNISAHGIGMGFSSVLLPQLQAPGSPIPLDVSSGSWIASVTGITLLVGNIILPSIMARFGRRTANLISCVLLIIGWFCIITAVNVTTLILARLLKGLAFGLTASLGSILVGEYTSPKNRGAFLATMSLALSTGVLIVHTLGIFFSWQMTALVSAMIAFVNLIIIIYSPESPSWLIDKERYSEGEKVFRWLRGPNEEDELRKMIQSKMIEQKSKVEVPNTIASKIKSNFDYLKDAMKKKEFHKPVFVMIHIYLFGSAANLLATYTNDLYEAIIGKNFNISPIVVSVDIQRLISNAIAIVLIKKIKRRTILMITIGLNIAVYFITAAYVYSRDNMILPFDSPWIGVMLIHLQMFTVATGTVPLPFILAGELFPLEYRGLAGGISVSALSIGAFVVVKTFPYLLHNVGLYGAYSIYGVVVSYCFIIALIFLPETKDRTLKDIEDEFKGEMEKPFNEGVKLTQMY